MILTIRTDKPDAEIGLFTPAGEEIVYDTWYAHRELADTLLLRIRDLLQKQGKSFTDVAGVVVFQGPGSFTGLRIGITVANTFAYAREIPIVGVMDEDWIAVGVKRLSKGENSKIILPEYGAEAHITAPRK